MTLTFASGEVTHLALPWKRPTRLAWRLIMPTTAKTARPVESTTRVTVAFPFGSIRMGSPTDSAPVAELAEVLADLTALLDRTHKDEGFADLAERARELAQHI
jgi:hypothetical protein